MKTLTTRHLDNIFIDTEIKSKGNVIPAFASHNSYEIYILKSGKRNIYIGQTLYETTPGDVAMIKCNVQHRSFGKEAYSGINVGFSDRCIELYFSVEERDVILSCFEKEIISIDEDTVGVLWEKAHSAMKNDSQKKDFVIDTAKAILQALPFTNTNSKIIFERDTSPIGVYIQNHYQEIKSLDDIATDLSLSKEYMCRLFKKDTGITIITYINSLRVQLACKLLQQTSISVGEISKICGFNTVIHFNRIFKNIMQNTPMEVRNFAQKRKIYKEETKSNIDF